LTTLLGIDCATQPAKTGLALGVLQDGVVHIQECAVATRGEPPEAIAADWLRGHDQVLIALDAPLGWPRPLSVSLQQHYAGQALAASANELFSRTTDRAIWQRLGKQPLEVGANLIARTAVAALRLLAQLRERTERSIPLAWEIEEPEPWRAIEVYPAATRIAHGAPDKGGSLESLESLLDCSAVSEAMLTNKDAVDACVCALAAADFLRGLAVSPDDRATALVEGWIWTAAVQSAGSSLSTCSS
jgi:predicted RNase H-like nuclease